MTGSSLMRFPTTTSPSSRSSSLFTTIGRLRHPLEIIDRLERLYSAGHVFLTLDATFDRAEMVREIGWTRSQRFWSGRTQTGDAPWQQHAADFGYE